MELCGQCHVLHYTPCDTYPLDEFQIRPAAHTPLGESFCWMPTRWALQCVKQSAEPSLNGRKWAFKSKFAHLQWLPAYLMNTRAFALCAARETQVSPALLCSSAACSRQV